ncbi:hypothetical protein ONZ43_g3848 [Nemania bipapillata]|uniref:Uncharacterized protein n=1 Tax=Nemania bipapillata TaxID=110536 RepID=A0ACC2IVE7_9PEZI|nr:hypothetical protein ONZ43_g3848 [Nemania bipapillata]
MAAGPRVTGPIAKLARSITTTTQPSTLLTSSKAGAPLSRKYADLLKERSTDPDTFSSTATPDATAKSVDNIVFPGSAAFKGASQDPFSNLRVPLLPDNVMFQHTPESTESAFTAHEISIVASNPDLVSPSALTEIEGMGMDGVELKFIHDAESTEQEPAMLTGLWRDLVDDVLGQQSSKKLAL